MRWLGGGGWKEREVISIYEWCREMEWSAIESAAERW